MNNKLLVIGLDGGTFDLLNPWMEDGTLPHLKKIKEEGMCGTLQSTIPPITAPAWTSFFTGKNPGKHGVYEFLVKKEGRYEETVVDSTSCKCKTLWELLGEEHKKIAVLNMPMTYPPQPVNGIMICGFLSSSKNRDYIYPRHLMDEIENRFGPYYLFGKTIDVITPLSDEHIKAFIDDCRKMSEYKFSVAHYVLEKNDFDFILFHEYGTDRIQHWLWHIMDTSHPRYEKRLEQKFYESILDYYHYVDEQIGKTIRLAGKQCSVIIMSDHGFCPVIRSIDLNAWLLGEGYIRIKRNPGAQCRYFFWKCGLTYEKLIPLWMKLIKCGFKPRISDPRDALGSFRIGSRQPLLSFNDVDWSMTKAYAKSSNIGQIIINLKGREPQGAVMPGEEYQLVRDEIMEKLKHLYDPQKERFVKGTVYAKEEWYHGDCSCNAPDITYFAHADRYMAGNVTGFGSNTTFTDFTGVTAAHSMEGIFMTSGAHIKKGATLQGADIMDLAPTILYLMGCKVPDDMDGKVLVDLFDGDYVQNKPIEYYTPESYTRGAGSALSPGDQEEIIDKLKSLGYYQ
jgi:predicted AlkP superfamily phosphohydrolase/phosphomutase